MKRSTKIAFVSLSVVSGVAVIGTLVSWWLEKEIEKCFKDCDLGEGFEEEKEVVPEIVDLRKERT